MQVNSSKDIINVAIVGTGASGKTSLVESILLQAGVISRLGSVQEGNTVSDYNPDEIQRQISINASVMSFNYEGKKINIIDTPGYPDFIGEVISALTVADNCLLVISGDSNVDAQTINILEQIKERNLPCIVFINKYDKENIDFNKSLENIEKNIGINLTPVCVPLNTGANIKDKINFLYDSSSARKNPMYEKYLENVVSNNEQLMEKYLGNEPISDDLLKTEIKKAFGSSQIYPTFCGSAIKLVSVKDVLDFIAKYAISSDESKLVDKNTASVSALVFKTTSEPGMGQMNYVKVYSGKFTNGLDIYNLTRNVQERVGQIAFLLGKKRIEATELIAGDIGVLIKLKDTRTNDILGEKNTTNNISHILFPEPMTEMAVVTKSKGEEEKVGNAFSNISLEEPTIKFRYNSETRQMVVAGIGTLQLDIIVKRIKSRYGVDIELIKPRIPYKETIKRPAQAEGKYKRQSGGRGQYGHCFIKVEPLERGKGFEFVDKIFGGAIPKNYIPSVEKGVVEAMSEGVIAGYPVVDIRVILYDGSYHEVDSSDMAFKIAGAMALKKVVLDASPCILEPIMDVEIIVPDDYLGGVMGDINSRRGRIVSLDKKLNKQVIKAQVPLSELHAYTMDLRSMTKGAGKFSMKFSHYEELLSHLAQPLIDEYQKNKKQEE